MYAKSTADRATPTDASPAAHTDGQPDADATSTHATGVSSAAPAGTATRETAVLGRRIGAQLLDGLASLVVFALVGGGATLLLGGLATGLRSPASALLLTGPSAMAAGALAAGALPIALEWGWDGQSLGKRALGIRVRTLEGRAPGLGSVVARNVLLAVDAMFGYLVGLAAILASADHQRIGDRIAGTVVVRDT